MVSLVFGKGNPLSLPPSLPPSGLCGPPLTSHLLLEATDHCHGLVQDHQLGLSLLTLQVIVADLAKILKRLVDVAYANPGPIETFHQRGCFSSRINSVSTATMLVHNYVPTVHYSDPRDISFLQAPLSPLSLVVGVPPLLLLGQSVFLALILASSAAAACLAARTFLLALSALRGRERERKMGGREVKEVKEKLFSNRSTFAPQQLRTKSAAHLCIVFLLHVLWPLSSCRWKEAVKNRHCSLELEAASHPLWRLTVAMEKIIYTHIHRL